MSRQVNALATLIRLRSMTITYIFGERCRMNQHEIGRQWGEGEYTASDLWRGR